MVVIGRRPIRPSAFLFLTRNFFLTILMFWGRLEISNKFRGRFAKEKNNEQDEILEHTWLNSGPRFRANFHSQQVFFFNFLSFFSLSDSKLFILLNNFLSFILKDHIRQASPWFYYSLFSNYSTLSFTLFFGWIKRNLQFSATIMAIFTKSKYIYIYIYSALFDIEEPNAQWLT